MEAPMKETHTITEAKLAGILSGKVSPLDLDDLSLLKPADILDKKAIIYGAWSIESWCRDSALVMLSTHDQSYTVFVLMRGNAAKQAIELHNRHRTPVTRILRKITLDKGYLYTWKMVRT
jgi:hypothetical protein